MKWTATSKALPPEGVLVLIRHHNGCVTPAIHAAGQWHAADMGYANGRINTPAFWLILPPLPPVSISNTLA